MRDKKVTRSHIFIGLSQSFINTYVGIRISIKAYVNIRVCTFCYVTELINDYEILEENFQREFACMYIFSLN